MKRIRNIALVGLSVIILLIGLLCLLIAGGTFNNIIVHQALKQANKTLNATVSLEKIEGNPFKYLFLSNVSIVQDNRQVLHIDKLQIQYNLARLLMKEILVEHIEINRLQIEVWQEPDSLWNIGKLYIQGDQKEKTETEPGLNFTIDLKKIVCNNLKARIQPLDTSSLIPKKIDANMMLSFLMKGSVTELKLKQFALKTEQPDLLVKNMNFDFRIDSSSYQWSGFRLQMPHTEMVSKGEYHPDHPISSFGDIHIDTLSFDDIRTFIPEFGLKGNPSVFLTARGDAERINFKIQVKEQIQEAEIIGWIKNPETIPEYDFVLDLKNLDGSSWTGRPEFRTKITGQLKAKGQGYDLQKSRIQTSCRFDELSFQDKTVRNLVLEAAKDSTKIDGNISSDTWFGAVQSRFTIFDYLSDFRYAIDLRGHRINLAKIYPSELNSSLNLIIQAKGKGMNPLKGAISTEINSYNSSIVNRPIENFSARFYYSKGNYILDTLHLNSPFFILCAAGRGNIRRENKLSFEFRTRDMDDFLHRLKIGNYSFDGRLQGDVNGSIRKYQVNTSFDIAQFSSDSLSLHDLSGDLKLAKDSDFHANSSIFIGDLGMNGFKFQELFADLKLGFDNEVALKLRFAADTIKYMQRKIGTGIGEINLYTKDSLRIDASLNVDSLNYVSFRTGKSDLRLNAQFADRNDRDKLLIAIHQLTDQYNYKPFADYLSGVKQKSARIEGHLAVANFGYNTLKIEKLGMGIDADASLTDYTGKLLATTNHVKFNDFVINDGSLSTNFSNLNFQNELKIKITDSVRIDSNFDIDMQNGIKIGLNHFELQSPLDRWKTESDSVRLIYTNDLLEIQNLKIAANDQKYVQAEGTFAFRGNEHLYVELHGLQVENINKIMGGLAPLSGTIDASVKLNGTSIHPELVAEVNFNDIQAYSEKIDNIEANLQYTGDTLKFDSQMIRSDTLIAEAFLRLPYPFSIENPQFLKPDANSAVKAGFKINQLDLGIINHLISPEVMTAQGLVSADLIASGPLNKINVDGSLVWKDGKFHYPEYGIQYDRIQMDVGVLKDSLYIREMKAEAGAGSIQLDGYGILDEQDTYYPKRLLLNLFGREFKVVDSDELEATINTSITLKNENGHPYFSGDLEVIRSEANADALIAEFNKASDDTEPPMLVKAMEIQSSPVQLASTSDTTVVKLNVGQKFFDNLRGKFNIIIPRNLWIRGKDMNFELKGELQAIKDGPNLVLFGSLEVRQGYYKFYGKRFDFKSGKITLTGDDDLNPILDFTVAYSFRDSQKTLKSLELNLTGRLKDPRIMFELNGNHIEEQDALSYLLFGGSIDELSDGQKSTLDVSTSAIAKNVALGQVSTLLRDAVQSSLKLDVVEIDGEDDWDAGSVTIGKYISANLYISYQYTFALDKKTRISDPQKVSIEYQLLNSLVLKGTNQNPNSGIDLVFKKEFK